MLKGLDPLLGPELLATLRAMGHGDEIALVDGNYPASADARRLVRADGHGADRLLAAILTLLPLDHAVKEAVFRPVHPREPEPLPIHQTFQATLQNFEPTLDLVPLEPSRFYPRVQSAYAIVATGERALYGNVILRKGVILPD